METDLATKLLAAARAGNVGRVRALVPCAGNPEEDGAPDAPGGIKQLKAAAGGHQEVVEVLLAAPALRGATRKAAATLRMPAPRATPLAKRLDTVVDKDQTIR